MPGTYTLLTPVGITPAVITETVYELFFKRGGWTPEAVHVVTTSTGANAVRARLLGEEGLFDHLRRPFAPANAWETLCRDVLGIAPPPIEIHVVTDGTAPLDDIRTPSEDRAFADACYRLVARLTAMGAPPLVGSISGGRKSMSAHVMNAFSALARPGDVLCHVLVNPARLEGRPDFFYPTDPASEKIDLVELAFPQLRPFLVKSLLEGREPRGLADLLDAARPHLLAEQTPASAEVVLGDRWAVLRLYDMHGAEMSKARLSDARVATFLVFANAFCAFPQGVEVGTVAHLHAAKVDREREPERATRQHEKASSHAVHQARQFVFNVMRGTGRGYEPWIVSADVSQAINEMKKPFKSKPVLDRFFSIESDHNGVYRWPEALPCPVRVRMAPALRLSERTLADQWPVHFPNLDYEWL